MFDLTGRNALVTGASGAIGGAIAKALHAQGAAVALSGTRREALDALAGELGERVHVATANLSDPEETEALPGRVADALGDLHILVNNAGLTRDMLAMRLSDDQWQSVIDVNLGAVFRLCRAALRTMVRRRYGRIVNIASIVGVTGNPGQGELCRVEGRHDRHDQEHRGGGRGARGDAELHRARFRRVADDRCAQREAAGRPDRAHPGRPHRRARRHRRRRGLAGERRGGLGDRPDPARQRRHGHGLRGRSVRRSSDTSSFTQSRGTAISSLQILTT